MIAALERLQPADVEALLGEVYDDVPAKLHRVAMRSLAAHLGKLVAEGRAGGSPGAAKYLWMLVYPNWPVADNRCTAKNRFPDA